MNPPIALISGLIIGLAVAAIVAVAAKSRLRRISDQSNQLQSKAAAIENEMVSLRRLAELGTLTGVLAHEIKNPLSTVGLNLQLMAEDLDPTNGTQIRLRNRLEVVQRETKRLRDFLDDFLRYAGKLELERKPEDLNVLLEELVDFFTPQAQLARVQIRLRPHPQAVVAEVDAKSIKQAVLNLMLNAVQAMTQGGELIISATAQPDGVAIIDIIDTGPGIESAKLDKIFQAYYSNRKGGTGLGLAMARRIAHEHGGDLTVQSEVGKGSRFSMRLPLATGIKL